MLYSAELWHFCGFPALFSQQKDKNLCSFRNQDIRTKEQKTSVHENKKFHLYTCQILLRVIDKGSQYLTRNDLRVLRGQKMFRAIRGIKQEMIFAFFAVNIRAQKLRAIRGIKQEMVFAFFAVNKNTIVSRNSRLRPGTGHKF